MDWYMRTLALHRRRPRRVSSGVLEREVMVSGSLRAAESSIVRGKRKSLGAAGSPAKRRLTSPGRSPGKGQEGQRAESGRKRKSTTAEGSPCKKLTTRGPQQSCLTPTEGPAEEEANDTTAGSVGVKQRQALLKKVKRKLQGVLKHEEKRGDTLRGQLSEAQLQCSPLPQPVPPPSRSQDAPSCKQPAGAGTGLKPLPNFMGGTPLEDFALTPTVVDLVRWIRGCEASLAVLPAPPGMGSSCAVQGGAALASAAYVRVPGFINPRLDTMGLDCAAKVVAMTGAGATVGEVECALRTITDAAVRCLMGDLRHKLAVRDMEEPPRSLNLILMSGEDQAGGAGVDLGVPQTVVLHIDQLGKALGVTQEKAPKASDPAVRGDWQLYTSSAFGQSLADTCQEVRNLRVALSVGLSCTVHKLHLPACVPQAHIQPVCPATPELVKPVLLRLLGGRLAATGRAAQSTMEHLPERLAGPFRLLSTFSSEVHLRGAERLTAKALEECLDFSYEQVCSELLTRTDVCGESNKGVLKAICAIQQGAGQDRMCRLTEEMKAEMSAVVATGILQLEGDDGLFVKVGKPSPFAEYVLDVLKRLDSFRRDYA